MLSRHSEDKHPSPGRNGLARRVTGALACSVGCMVALHVVGGEFDPVVEPISFYVHGPAGWLLIASLATFAAASMDLSRMVAFDRNAQRALRAFGWGMLVIAFVPSDRWFLWEHPPTWHGLVHAGAAMFAPLLLLVPMRDPRACDGRPQAGFLAAYVGALLACAVSLGVGFWQDGAPPYIGLAERALALVAVAWMGFAISRV